MLRGITARQFQEWRHYADLEPFDEERADSRSASIVQAVWNAAVLVATRGKKQGHVKLETCLLTFGAPAVAQPNTEEQAKTMAAQVRRTMDMMVESQKPKPRKRG